MPKKASTGSQRTKKSLTKEKVKQNIKKVTGISDAKAEKAASAFMRKQKAGKMKKATTARKRKTTGAARKKTAVRRKKK